MSEADYKGYELIKAIHDGKIKDGKIIEVHDLSTLEHVKARIEYSNKRLNWIAGEFDTGCLFDDNIYFRVLEDNTEEIEEIPTKLVYGSAINGNPEYQVTQKEIVDKINELVKSVNAIREKPYEAIQVVLNELDKKDKVMELMANSLTTDYHDTEWVKEYFYKLAEEILTKKKQSDII